MSDRELVVLGTASQTPTRARNQNGYLLRWDGTGLLFDPGEGTQRQMLLAGVRASEIHHICLTHFHGDHCLGLPGVLHRLSLDRVAHPVDIWFPAQSAVHFDRLRYAAICDEQATLRPHPVEGPGTLIDLPHFRLSSQSLVHTVPSIGYQLAQPDSRRMIPHRLAALGVTGPQIGLLIEAGSLTVDGHTVTMEEVSEFRPGQRFAFIMDTRLCDGVFALAEGADAIVCESTFLNRDVRLAEEYGHLTAGQAGRVAAESGARLLILSHFSQRYAHDDGERFAEEAREAFGGQLVAARDLTRIPMPPRTEGVSGDG